MGVRSSSPHTGGSIDGLAETVSGGCSTGVWGGWGEEGDTTRTRPTPTPSVPSSVRSREDTREDMREDMREDGQYGAIKGASYWNDPSAHIGIHHIQQAAGTGGSPLSVVRTLRGSKDGTSNGNTNTPYHTPATPTPVRPRPRMFGGGSRGAIRMGIEAALGDCPRSAPPSSSYASSFSPHAPHSAHSPWTPIQARGGSGVGGSGMGGMGGGMGGGMAGSRGGSPSSVVSPSFNEADSLLQDPQQGGGQEGGRALPWTPPTTHRTYNRAEGGRGGGGGGGAR